MAAGILITSVEMPVDSAGKPKLNKTSVKISVGTKYKLRLKNGNKKAKVTWKTNNKKAAKLSSKSSIGNKAFALVYGAGAG